MGDHHGGIGRAGLMKENELPEDAIPKESLELRKEWFVDYAHVRFFFQKF